MKFTGIMAFCFFFKGYFKELFRIDPITFSITFPITFSWTLPSLFHIIFPICCSSLGGVRPGLNLLTAAAITSQVRSRKGAISVMKSRSKWLFRLFTSIFPHFSRHVPYMCPIFSPFFFMCPMFFPIFFPIFPYFSHLWLGESTTRARAWGDHGGASLGLDPGTGVGMALSREAEHVRFCEMSNSYRANKKAIIQYDIWYMMYIYILIHDIYIYIHWYMMCIYIYKYVKT